MAINIPGSGPNDLFGAEADARLNDQRVDRRQLSKSIGKQERFGSYAATGTESSSEFNLYMFKIPAGYVVTQLYFEHGKFQSAGAAFNCNVGTENDPDCFVVDASMANPGRAVLGKSGASLRGPQAEDEWLVVNFEAPGAAMAEGAQLRIWAKMVDFS